MISTTCNCFAVIATAPKETAQCWICIDAWLNNALNERNDYELGCLRKPTTTTRGTISMSAANWGNRTLWTGDNLDVLHGMNSE